MSALAKEHRRADPWPTLGHARPRSPSGLCRGAGLPAGPLCGEAEHADIGSLAMLIGAVHLDSGSKSGRGLRAAPFDMVTRN